MALRSPLDAGTRSAPRRSARCAILSSASGSSLACESQLRWLGPEKGVIHLAMAAVVNAVWDLYAKAEGKPLWKLLSDMTPAQLVGCIDFRYITDALTPDEGIDILARQAKSRSTREAQLLASGCPAYTTSAGWMGYSNEHIRQLCRDALAQGWRHFKVKVGASAEEDARRLTVVRAEIGRACKLMIDANQRWEVNEAIARVRELERFDLWWIEEPTSPDDVLGHAVIAKAVRPVGVATGEHCPNRVVFKQFLQARTPAASGCASSCSTCRCSTTSRSPGATTTVSPSMSITCTNISSTRLWFETAGTSRRRYLDSAAKFAQHRARRTSIQAGPHGPLRRSKRSEYEDGTSICTSSVPAKGCSSFCEACAISCFGTVPGSRTCDAIVSSGSRSDAECRLTPECPDVRKR